jgi:hypothetical protein
MHNKELQSLYSTPNIIRMSMKDQLTDVGIELNIILKLILNKYGEILLIRFIGLRIWSLGWLL